MSTKIPIEARGRLGPRLFALAALAMAAAGPQAPATAQEPAPKTVGEHIKEYWEKMIAKAEATARSTGDEYHRLKERAAKATGPARAKMDAEMEALGRKWSEARTRLAAGIDLRMHSLSEEIATMEEKAGKAAGPARAKMDAELKKLREEWEVARRKMGAAMASSLEASREEFRHLEEQAKDATAESRAKLGPRMDRLAAEWRKDRERLTSLLEADLERTREEMKKLGGETSDAARHAVEAMAKKSRELAAKIKELAEEPAPGDGK